MGIMVLIIIPAILIASSVEALYGEGIREKSGITCVTAATNSNDTILDRLDRCVRSMASQFIDHLVDGDSVSLMDGVKLVRVKKLNEIDKIEYGRDWSSRFFYKVAQLLETHVIRIRLNGWLGRDDSEGRGLKKRHQMKHFFPMMVMGYMFMSSFMVPLGFQLMAVLSGKALLLSKLAFLMSGMHGFKRLFLGVDYPAVIHHDTVPVYHDHHASSTWRRNEVSS